MERVIYLYNSKSTRNEKKAKKKEEKNNKNNKNIKIKKNKEKTIIDEEEEEKTTIFFQKPQEDTLNDNDFEISPIKLESRNTIGSKEHVKNSNQKQKPNKKQKGKDKKSKKTMKKQERFYLYPIFFKYIFHLILLVLFCYFTLILMPTGATNDFPKRCVQVDGTVDCFLSETNGYLLGFYFLYCLYFLFSSFQIR